MKQYAIPEYITASDIKRVRGKLGLTQAEFSKLVGVSKPTIERYEITKDKIYGMIVLIVKMIEDNMNYIEELE